MVWFISMHYAVARSIDLRFIFLLCVLKKSNNYPSLVQAFLSYHAGGRKRLTFKTKWSFIFVTNITWFLSYLLEMRSKNNKIFISDYHKSILLKSHEVTLPRWVWSNWLLLSSKSCQKQKKKTIFFVNLINETKNSAKIIKGNVGKRLYGIFTPTENVKNHKAFSPV